MKCKNCGGTGYFATNCYADIEECITCDGTGVVEPMTNEEYIKSLDVEELAAWIYQERWTHSDGWYEQRGHTVEEVKEWLKEKHE